MLKRDEKGMISLEASISVISFLVLMLLLAGFFRMFMAQNVTAHAALETAESLSLDAYGAKKLGNGGFGSVGEFINGIFGMFNDDDFSSYNDWFSSAEGKQAVEQEVKTRFVAYLTGGDEQEADDFLKRLNVVDGLNGIDFSKSNVENGMLYVKLRYKLKYDFKMGNLSEIDVDQKACAKIWQ